jgi:SAM-dependent methyltransferase
VNPEDVRRQWATRSGEFSPEYYAHRGPDETSEAISELLESVQDGDTVLELGCSSGRHLAYLLENGFEDLTGIEVNAHAIEVMAASYPALAAAGTFQVEAIEDALSTFADDEFSAVYSVETLQHIHPDNEWVFEELARITEELLITVENEGGHAWQDSTEIVDGYEVNHVDEGVPLYYRDWSCVFTDLGFVEIDTQVGTRDTLRAFRPPGSNSSN